MKKILSLLLLILCCFSITVSAEDSGNVSEILNDYIDLYSIEIENGISPIKDLDVEKIIPDFSVTSIMSDIASGNMDISVGGIFNKVLKMLMSEIYMVFKIMVLVLAMSIVCSYLTTLQSNFQKDGVGQIAFFACYIVICGVAIAAFYEVISYGETAIENMSLFMQTIVPLMLMSLITSGAPISATVFQPVLITVIEITILIIKNFFIPLVMLSTAINVVNNLTDKFNADRLVQLINKIVKWGLGALLTIFVGVAGIQGISASSADGLSVKVTKFATSNLIPIVGGILADSVETIMNCSVVIKNSIGVFGVIMLVIIAILPLVKIAANLIVFRLTAAVIEPISEKKIVKCMVSLADSITMMFSMVASVAVMFIIILTIVINAGNMAVLMGR